MSQDNSRRAQVLRDLKTALDAMQIFRLVDFSVRSPEEVAEFPMASLVGGDETRSPADIQNVHFESEMEAVCYVYWKERNAGWLAIELEEEIIQKVLDKLDAEGQLLKYSHGYDMFVSNVETDKGTLSVAGMPVAVGIITIKALLPAMDAI
jgi:hypothetical protein